MSTDPFERFGEQQQSFELLEEHREKLAADAAELARERPDLEPVGLIMDADASEAAEMRATLEKATGQRIGGFLGVVPRQMVLDILRANAPATLDHLEPVSSGRHRKLPLVAITKNGYRLGAVDYEVPE